MSVEDAALDSARLRFRPILMTAFAFILGVVPLMLSSGAGSGAQNVMGTAVFWGMLVATFLGVLIIPGNFTLMQNLNLRFWKKKPVARRGGSRTCAGRKWRWTRVKQRLAVSALIIALLVQPGSGPKEGLSATGSADTNCLSRRRYNVSAGHTIVRRPSVVRSF